MPNVWTKDDTEKLIALYAQYQYLWNPFHPEFNSKSLRYEAYKEIRNSMNISGLTICDCIKRIEKVKKEYCYELSKIAAAIFCEKLYVPKAKWFKTMHMLFFPYTSISYNNSRKQDNNYRKFNHGSMQDKFLHSPFEKSEGKHVCSYTCGTCELQEIELCLRLRDTVSSALKLQDTLIPSEMIQAIDVATETSNDIAERETQTDLSHERKIVASDIEGKKDRSTCTDDIPVEVHGRKKIEDSFDIFGKSIAFQLRTIDIQIAVELEKEIQNLMTKVRLKTLESKLMDQSSNSICCCDCNDCKVMCKDETCSCGLTLKECLLLTKIRDNKDYGFCYKQ